MEFSESPGARRNYRGIFRRVRFALACRTEPSLEIYAKIGKVYNCRRKIFCCSRLLWYLCFQQAFGCKNPSYLFDAAHDRYDCTSLPPFFEPSGLENSRLLAEPLDFKLQVAAVDAPGDVRVAGDTHAATPALASHAVGEDIQLLQDFLHDGTFVWGIQSDLPVPFSAVDCRRRVGCVGLCRVFPIIPLYMCICNLFLVRINRNNPTQPYTRG